MTTRPINHKSVCSGDLICPRCGRRMCINCVTEKRPGVNPYKSGHEGECIICSEMYKEEEIKLWPRGIPVDLMCDIGFGKPEPKKSRLRFIRIN